MTETISIRLAGSADAGALALLGGAAFLETYAALIPSADIVAHCTRRHAPAIYAAWLADPVNTLWLAETPIGGPVGYLVLTPALLPEADPHPDDLEVQRIYVLSRFHGGGVGYRLMDKAVSHAGAKGARQLVLGVMKTNTPAVTFYQRQGFSVTGVRSFVVGQSIFDDFIMGRTF